MQRTVIKFQANVPRTIVLDKGPEGKETSSKLDGAPQWQYTVNQDASVLWLPAQARTALLESGAKAGDTVQICKRASGWEVKLGPDAAEKPEAPQGIRVVTPRPAPQPQPYSKGATAAQPKPAPQPVESTQAIPETSPTEELLARCWTAAGRALWRTYKTLASEGIEIEPPNFEDVRCGGIAVYIERTRTPRNGGNR